MEKSKSTRKWTKNRSQKRSKPRRSSGKSGLQLLAPRSSSSFLAVIIFLDFRKKHSQQKNQLCRSMTKHRPQTAYIIRQNYFHRLKSYYIALACKNVELSFDIHHYTFFFVMSYPKIFYGVRNLSFLNPPFGKFNHRFFCLLIKFTWKEIKKILNQ